MTDDINPLYRPFVIERHRIWERRLAGLPAPWCTTDDVLRANKFTNVYRALDAGSQFLISELLDPWADPQVTLLRCFLYRYTNRPEPWIAWKNEVGHYPDHGDLKSGQLRMFWEGYQASGLGIFSPAYQMFVGKENAGSTRLSWVLALASQVFCSGPLEYMIDEWITDYNRSADGMKARVAMLQNIPRCGPFMAMQITTDYGYSHHAQANENDFILAGPGARAGVKAFSGSRDAEAVIREQTAYWADQPEPRLFGRPPSLMDVQNTFCEFSKYVRYHRADEIAGPPSIHRYYRGHGDMPWPVLPDHWELPA